MRVLMIGNHESVHGGITSVIRQLLSHDWSKENVDMEFLPSYAGGNILNKIVYFSNAYRNIKKRIKSNSPDLVHIHMSHHGSFTRANYILRLCLKNGIPVIVHLHGSEFAKFYEECNTRKKEIIQAFFNNCACVITLGESWAKFVSSVAKKANIIILNNTVHIPDIVVKQEIVPINFLFLGVLFERKGVADLLKSINKLKQEKLLSDNNVVFNIGGSGPEEEKLRTYVADNDLQDNVKFLGWVAGEDKIKQLENNDIFVLPSYNEGLPIAILEAISYGMPVVATSVGSVKEAVKPGINGFLVEPGDIEGYVFALKKLIEDYELRYSMSKASRNLAITTFNEQSYFDEISSIYRIISTE